MHSVARAKAANWPLILGMWALTLMAALAAYWTNLPFGTGLCLNFASNIAAVLLLFSPHRADILHGCGRLALQLALFALTLLLLFQNGFSVSYLMEYVRHIS